MIFACSDNELFYNDNAKYVVMIVINENSPFVIKELGKLKCSVDNNIVFLQEYENILIGRYL